MEAPKSEEYNNIGKKVSNDKYEQKYGGNIEKVIKDCLFGVGTLVLKYENILYGIYIPSLR